MATTVRHPEAVVEAPAPQALPERLGQATERSIAGRLVSLDAYRGFIMLLLVSEGADLLYRSAALA